MGTLLVMLVTVSQVVVAASLVWIAFSVSKIVKYWLKIWSESEDYAKQVTYDELIGEINVN